MISRTMLMLCITMTLLASPVVGRQATLAAPSATYEMVVLPDPGGVAAAMDINERGEIVGSAQFADDSVRPVRPFYWIDGEATDLGDLDGAGGAAFAINDNGQVTGYARNPEAGEFDPLRGRAFLWQDGRLIAMDGLPDGWSWGVNNTATGIVTGFAGGPDGFPHAYLWQRGEVIWLNALVGVSSAVGINDRAVVVGYWREAPTDFDSDHAVVWRPTEQATPVN